MRRLCVTLALVLACNAAGAQTRGYHVVKKPRLALALTGAGLFIAGYALAFVTAFTPEANGEAWCAVPLVGPWVAIARDAKVPLDYLNFATQGALQVTGAILLAIGLVPREVHVAQTITTLAPSGIILRF
jgi:hypothetical protein